MFDFMSVFQSMGGMNMGGMQPMAGTGGMNFGNLFSGMSGMQGMSNMASIFTVPPQSTGNGGTTWGGMGVSQPMVQMSGGLFGYMGGTDSPAAASYRQPIYSERYERQPVYTYTEHKAWDYKFQTGQSVHQTEDTADQQVRILEARDPVILDLNKDGKVGVTGATDTRQRVNEKVDVTTRVNTVGNQEITDINTHREWDLLVNWDKKIDFDVNADGTVDRTEWLEKGSGDGFMVLDADDNGQITGRELMNETGLDGEQGLYKSGWDKARALFDKDGDGVLAGEELKGVKIWADANGDGKTDAGELKTMEELGIVKIDTNTGSFTEAQITGYETVYHKEEIGYVEHNTYAGSNTYGVGSRLVIGGRVLQDFQMGA